MYGRSGRRISQRNIDALSCRFLRGQGSDTCAHLHVDVFNHGSDVLGQVIDRHAFNLRIRIPGM